MSGFGRSLKGRTVPKKNESYAGVFDFDQARKEGRGDIHGGEVITASGTAFRVCGTCRHMEGRESALKDKCQCCKDGHQTVVKKSLPKNR